jgi:hypothetical protein
MMSVHSSKWTYCDYSYAQWVNFADVIVAESSSPMPRNVA